MPHTFKQTPTFPMKYIVVDGCKISIGDWIHVYSGASNTIQQVVGIDIYDPFLSCCYSTKGGKRIWPRRGDYCKLTGGSSAVN